MMKQPVHWLIMAIVLAVVGIYFDKPDFETSLLVLICFGIGSIIANIQDLK